MPSNLTLAPTKPYKSSRLALPPSPFSPLTPLTLGPSAPTTKTSSTNPTLSAIALPPPPSEPLAWLWQCHICNRVYRLGTTRRCLEDGHFFCSGTTTVKRSRKHAGKKVVRHKACASEFDYAGWKGWGVWRRDVVRRVERAEEERRAREGVVPRPLFAPKVPGEGHWLNARWVRKGMGIGAERQGAGFFEKKDCWGTCDYPSECRWGKQYGVQTPALASFPEAVQDESQSEEPKTTFDDILLTMPALTTTSSSHNDVHNDSDGSSASELDTPTQSPPLSPILPETPEEPTRKPSFDDLLESVKRRKRRSSGALVEISSPLAPLASHPPSPTTISMAEAMDLATHGSKASTSSAVASEHIEDVAAPQGSGAEGAGQTALPKAFDDFDLEFRRSFEKAGAALTGFVSAVRSSTAALEEEKAEGFVRSLSRRERGGQGVGKRWT